MEHGRGLAQSYRRFAEAADTSPLHRRVAGALRQSADARLVIGVAPAMPAEAVGPCWSRDLLLSWLAGQRRLA